MRHLNIRIFGQVQGVFFRSFAKEMADALDIKGFVRNEPDGSVYIEAEGDEENLQKFLEWCKQGSDGALVEKTEITEINESGAKHFSGFKIL